MVIFFGSKFLGKAGYKDGSNYSGCYKRNLKNGYGVCEWDNGIVYNGDWLDD